MDVFKIRTPHGEIPTYLCKPASDGAWPGIVLIHDVMGISRDLENQMNWLASEGYIVAAPDFFHWGGKVTCLRTLFRDTFNRKGRTFDEIEAVRAWLVQQKNFAGKVGVIGFCMGGGFALLLAPGHGFSASCVNYGVIPHDAEVFLADSCPMIGSFGGKDRTLRGASRKLENALQKNNIPHDIKEYPMAGHSFMNEHLKSETPIFVKIMGVLSQAVFNESDARDARHRILLFFNRYLKS